MSDLLRILLLEDSIADADLVARELKRAGLGHELTRVQTREDFYHALAEFKPDVILSDHTMPGYDGLTALKDARTARPMTPFIFVSGTLGEERAVESLKKGASDYVIKGDLIRLPSAITRAIEEKRLRREREQAEQKLRASEALFKTFAEQAPIGIMLTDTSGRVTFCNRQFGAIFGRDAEELRDNGFAQSFHPEDAPRVMDAMAGMLDQRRSVTIDYRVLHAAGGVRWVSSSGAPQYGADGSLAGFIGVLVDNTERVLAEHKILRLTRIHEVLSGINSTIVRVNDRAQLCRDVCHIALEKGKFSLAWIVLADPASGRIGAGAWRARPSGLGEHLKLHKPANLYEASAIGMDILRSGKPLLINDIAATELPIDLREVLVDDGFSSIAYLPLALAGRAFGILVLATDTTDFFTIDEMKLLDELTEDIAFALDHLEKEEKLNYLAYYDALTGLPNRMLFLDHLRIAIADAEREGKSVAMLMINIERFRHVNESLGEAVGDSLLKSVADALGEWASNDDQVGRLGGDVFGLFFPRLDDISSIPGRIERKYAQWIKSNFDVLGHEVAAPLRFGVAFYPGDGGDAETVFQNANAALKEAKRSGETLLFYSHEFNARAAELLRLEHRLRHAIDHGELVLHYQPKIDLESRRVRSIEALMRWQDEERGLVPPGEFIPVLEQTGMIQEAGLWALRQARADRARLCQWSAAAPRIAVNVSSAQLKRKTFRDELLQAIGGPSVEHGIEIEITESLLMDDISANIAKLYDIREHDVRIAIDDFGTGYSSLAYIARLPIDILKIDRGFIVRMAEDADNLAIVSTIIALAHALGLRVVAEGVETAAQAEQLRVLGCDEAQGYLFCRPLPFDALVERLAADGDGVILLP